MMPRILAVLTALCVVVAFALAMLLPPDTSLVQLVAMVDQDSLVSVQNFVRVHISAWAWNQLAMPMLQRPCWLLPAELGLIFAGLTATFASRRGAARSHRRRS
jgi:hypothetical protein